MREYTLKQSPDVEYVFGSPPESFPHGRVEISQMNYSPAKSGEDIFSAKAVGVYLKGFNSYPIRYFVFEVCFGRFRRKKYESYLVELASLTELQKEKAIELIQKR